MFTTKDTAERHVVCETCKCWLSEKDAQKIEFHEFYSQELRYYCAQHRKNYESVGLSFRGRVFFRKVEVSEDGVPVGYIRKQESTKTKVPRRKYRHSSVYYSNHPEKLKKTT